MKHENSYREDAAPSPHGSVRQPPPGFLEETMERIRQLDPPRYRLPIRVWYATLYSLRCGWDTVEAWGSKVARAPQERLALTWQRCRRLALLLLAPGLPSPESGVFQRLWSWGQAAIATGKRWVEEQALCQGKPHLDPERHLWIETVAVAVLPLAEHALLPPVSLAYLQRSRFWWLRRIDLGMRLSFGPLGTGHAKPLEGLEVVATLEAIARLLQSFPPGAFSTSGARAYTSAQVEQVAARIRRQGHRWHWSEADTRHVIAVVVRHLGEANA